MMILNDEKMKEAGLPYHAIIRPYSITDGERAVAKAQHQLDLKEFIEWLEQYVESHEHANLVDIIGIPYDEWQSLKQLVEEE